ncbi:MAG TPA: DUF4349 domain-containing protein [Acidimicrobiia bacterium]
MKRLIIVLGTLTLVLAACSGDSVVETFSEVSSGLSGGGDDLFVDDGATEARSAPIGELDEDGVKTASNDFNLDVAVSDDRKVIRNASLQLEADDTRGTYDEIVRITESVGGFVASAEVSPTNDGQPPVVYVTVRIPAAELTNALSRFKDAATEVIAESQGAQDVTETYIDLEAQLTNLTALEVELRALLEEVRKQPDADPDKLLRVFTEISNTRGQIEQIQGQLNYLSDAVDLATATITVQPTPQAVPIVEESWTPADTARDASRTLVTGLQNLGDAAITFAIAVLPMLLLVVVIPALVLYAAYRWWRSRKQDRPAAPPAQPLPSE